MKRLSMLSLIAMCAILVAAPVFGAVRYENGMRIVDDSVPQDMSVAPLGSSGISGHGYTGFDDTTPCSFDAAFPMTKTWYSTYGLQVKGPNSKEGGALLNECSAFGVTSYSAPTFMAFNCNATMANGGRAIGPETFQFSPPVAAVQISVGSVIDAGQTLLIQAKSADGGTVASSSPVLTSNMQFVTLSGAKAIKKLVISVPNGSSACSFVIDDITYGTLQ